MTSSINTNIAAYYAQGNIAKASAAATTSVARLSSGNFITKASDDVARLSIGTSFATTVKTLRQALTNASQGISLLQVADGALGQITDILQRQKTLAVQASSGNLSATDRGFLNQEFQALSQQIDFIANTSSFNGVKLLDGALSTSSRLDDATKQAATGVASIGLSSNLADGDSITINGLVFTAKNTVANAQQFQIGATASDTAKNLADKLTALSSSNAATITDSTTTYAQKLGQNTYSSIPGGTTVTIASRTGGSQSNKFTIDASAITSGAVNVSGQYGSATVDLLASNVSAFTSATSTVAVASGQSATSPFKVGDSLSLQIDGGASTSLYTFQTGDSLTDIVNGINGNSAGSGVSATLIGDSTSGYNIRLNLSRSTGTNVSINGGDSFYKVAATGVQTTTLSGATSTTNLLSSSLATAIGSTSATVTGGTATAPFAVGSSIYASVNGGTYVDISGALGASDGLDDIVAKINGSAGAGSLGIVASLSGNNIQIKYADSQQTGQISFYSGTSAASGDLVDTNTVYNTDALGQNHTNGLGGSFVTFNLLSTGVAAPDSSLTAAASSANTPFVLGTGTIVLKINDSATTQKTLSYTVGSGNTLQDLANTINSDTTAGTGGTYGAKTLGIHASVVRDASGNYNLELAYASSALPTAGTAAAVTGNTATASGIKITYTNSSLTTVNTTGTLNNTSATGDKGSDVSVDTTYRLFTTAFAQALPTGSTSVTAASAAAATPFVNGDTISVRYGTTNLVISDALATGDTLADIVQKINNNTTGGTASGISATLDGNGNILLHNDASVVPANAKLYFSGGANFYNSGTATGNGLNNAYSTVNLFAASITSATLATNLVGAAQATPLAASQNLTIDVNGQTTITVAIGASETVQQLLDAINTNANAIAAGVHATFVNSGAANANIVLSVADKDNTGVAATSLTTAETGMQAGSKQTAAATSFVSVDNILSKSNTYDDSASTSVGITSNNVVGLVGGADTGLGIGSTTVTGSVSNSLLTSLAQKAAQVTIGFPDTDPAALSDAFTGKNIVVAGTTFTFAASASSPTEIAIGSTLQATLDNAVSAINKFGKESAIGDAAFQLNQLNVTRSGNNIVFSGKGIGDVTKLDGTASNGISSTVANISGPTNGGTLNTATRHTTGTFGVDVSGVSNADFAGTISGFTADYSGTANTVNLSIKIGNNTYTATSVNTKPTVGATGSDSLGNEIVRFYSDTYEDANGKQINGGYFDVQLAVNQGDSVASQSDATAFGTRFNSAFQGLNFNQTRVISSYTGANSVINASGTTIGSLVGSTVSAQLPSFDGNKLTNVSVTAPTGGSADATISLTIDGVKYTSHGVGSSLGANQTYKFVNESNPSYFVNFTTGDTSIDLSSAENANALQKSLYTAFGASEGSSALSFQIGTKSSESLGVSIGAATTDSLFDGATLNITTIENASAASDAIDKALGTVTSIRASVGALQSRFNFASANIQISAQNQDASRSELLDTDIAAESTSYATSQVQLQAGISVLAQANQQLQALLKLLG